METLNHYLSLCLIIISSKVLLSLGLRKHYKLKNVALAPYDTKTISIPKSGVRLMKEYSKFMNIIGNLSCISKNVADGIFQKLKSNYGNLERNLPILSFLHFILLSS